MPKILITGAKGQLGMALSHHPKSAKYQLFPLTRSDLDVTQLAAVDRAIRIHSPDMIIHAAAYTAVDKAEEENELALHINYQGTKNISISCQQHNIPLIYLSTDYVFDGKKALPYHENDPVNPINRYGESKYLGEQAVQHFCEHYYILRVSGIFSEYGNNFVKTILRLAQERKELHIVADQMTCPTYASDIVDALFSLINEKPPSGCYHFCNETPLSWYQFASILLQKASEQTHLLVERIHPIASSNYTSKAKRPSYSVLDNSKLQKAINLKSSYWKDAFPTLLPALLSSRIK